MSPDERLLELGIEVPQIPVMPFRPALVGVHIHGGLAYLSGMGPIGVTGVLGGDMTVDEGYLAARTRGCSSCAGSSTRSGRWTPSTAG